MNALGHAHPHLVHALTEQAGKLWHTSNLYRIPEGSGSRSGSSSTFADTVFFSNSGAEANEAAIKMARKYHAANGQPERFRIITFEGHFTAARSPPSRRGPEKVSRGFGPKVEGFDQVAFGDHEGVKSAITPETAAILIEPIQGRVASAVPTSACGALRAL